MSEQTDLFSPPEKLSFGTEPHKLVRHGDPSTSIEAAFKIDSTALERMVFETIRLFGEKGCISDEVRDVHHAYPYSSVTARYKALIDKGYIVDTGERRAGHSGRTQRVLRAIK